MSHPVTAMLQVFYLGSFWIRIPPKTLFVNVSWGLIWNVALFVMAEPLRLVKNSNVWSLLVREVSWQKSEKAFFAVVVRKWAIKEKILGGNPTITACTVVLLSVYKAALKGWTIVDHSKSFSHLFLTCIMTDLSVATKIFDSNISNIIERQ